MRTLASRVAIVGSLPFLIIWIVSAPVATTALAAENFGLAATLARPAWTIDLPLSGFLGLMVLGLAGFGLLLGMALSDAAGTFQTLAANSPPAEMAPSRR